MNYYQIVFPDFMRLLIRTPLTHKQTCELIKGSYGIIGLEHGTVYNPKHYLYIKQLDPELGDVVTGARNLGEVLFV